MPGPSSTHSLTAIKAKGDAVGHRATISLLQSIRQVGLGTGDTDRAGGPEDPPLHGSSVEETIGTSIKDPALPGSRLSPPLLGKALGAPNPHTASLEEREVPRVSVLGTAMARRPYCLWCAPTAGSFQSSACILVSPCCYPALYPESIVSNIESD